MDPSVVAALAKWPDVPDVYGWLGLTARGEWRLRGQPIGNAALRDFIGRNYAGDECGRWFFQNGPQRVYVVLEAAPWVWQFTLDGGKPALQSHTGARASQLRGAWVDDSGRVFLMTELGFGLFDSRDNGRIIDAMQPGGQGQLEPGDLAAGPHDGAQSVVVHGAPLGISGDAPLGRVRAAEMPDRFGFVRSPQPD